MSDGIDGGIFISYRRKGDRLGGAPQELKRKLTERFPGTSVFLDVDSIQPGRDFTEVIGASLDSCSVLLALIGPYWGREFTGEQRRLFSSDDWVRREIERALQRRMHVVPVLIGRSTMPREDEVPVSLRKLVQLQAAFLRTDEEFGSDVESLCDELQSMLRQPPAQWSAPDRTKPAVGTAAIQYGPPGAPRVLIDAERVAQSIADVAYRGYALTRVYCDLARLNPSQSGRFLSEAETFASAIPSGALEAEPTRVLIAEARTATSSVDPLAPYPSPEWLHTFRVLAVKDPDQAESMVGSGAIPAKERDRFLGELAEALTATDPDRAERTVMSVTDKKQREEAAAKVARRLASSDPAWAARLLGTEGPPIISYTNEGKWALVKLCLLHGDIDGAERHARSITKKSKYDRSGVRDLAMGDIAVALIATDPRQAKRFIRSIKDKGCRAGTLANAAAEVMPTDPGRARGLVRAAKRAAARDDDDISSAYGRVARALAPVSPEIALGCAEKITQPEDKVLVLLKIAEARLAT